MALTGDIWYCAIGAVRTVGYVLQVYQCVYVAQSAILRRVFLSLCLGVMGHARAT